METPARLAAFTLALAAAGVLAFGVGRAIGPLGSDPADAADQGHGAARSGEHGAPGSGSDGGGGSPARSTGVTGLAVSDAGLTLRTATTDLRVGVQPFRFVIETASGEALRDYDLTHERELHLVVVRRDMTRFQHVHPVRDEAGRWSIDLDLTAPGPYRVYADFAPAGSPPRALGVDVVVPGAYDPAPGSRGEQRVAAGGGYEVTSTGALRAGSESLLRFDVRREGAPVTDLDPYLGALGHLVVLREGDLAYLHVHPESEDLAFATTVPSSGGYAAFLDTSHRGTVRTAAFRLVASR